MPTSAVFPSQPPLTKMRDKFVPHDQPPDQRSLSVRRPDNSVVIDSKQLQHIKSLAKPERLDGQKRYSFQKQKNDLHEKSLQRVKGWGNTIPGMRRQRLAAKEERMTKLEEERQRIDAEWARVKASERNAAIERAKYLRRIEEPRVKQMTSALLLANVLQERDEQLAAREEQDQQQDARQNADTDYLLHIENDAINAEKKERLKHRIQALETAEEQKRQALEKQKELNNRKRGQKVVVQRQSSHGPITEEITESEARARELEAEQAAEKQKKAIEREKKRARDKEEQKALDQAVQLHKEEKRKKAAEEQKALEENAKFAEMKQLFDARRKNAQLEIVQQRQHRTELAARVAAEEAEKKRQKVEAFYDRILHGADGYWEKRFSDDQNKRDKALHDVHTFQAQHDKEVREKRQQERRAAVNMRHHLEEQDIEDMKQAEERKHAAQESLTKLKVDHKVEIQRHEQKRAEQAAQERAAELAALEAVNAHDEEFEKEALDLIHEWQNAGKDVRPLLRVLRQERSERKGIPKNPTLPGGMRLTDTFSRLGMGTI
ncbi:uncharacterized protein EV422DRAFT_544621 [Fimicolochytrium jonesii]|uniref:uncharacterized protein n=1 Tax=Fimicolochytrium jonesii TaxID=1396493 RepID=UPI0022FE57D2|nr:uncharacterized protein EV422DRAFT_544621 [Fimicolochytrium jonesii]KAI8816739.1 hypothetical protein EV422DRAFT_544621 [Fimicolochytrium jonesii]